MSLYTHPATGDTIHRLTGNRQYIAALSLGLTGHETEEGRAALGFVPYVPPVPPPSQPLPQTYSKLKIVRALIGLGQDSAFFDWLESDRAIKAQWDAATQIQSDDETFGAALQTFVAAVALPPGVTVQQVLEDCRI